MKNTNLNTTVFAEEFDEKCLARGLKSESMNDLKEYLVENNLALYVPYPLDDYNEDTKYLFSSTNK